MNQSHTCLAVASAALALAGSQPEAEGATVITPGLGAQVVGRDFDVLFDPIDSVSDLVSISAGSVSTQEGGSIVISAILGNNSLVQLFSGGLPFNIGGTVGLDTITGNSFTDFATPVVVKGLHFTLNTTSGPTVSMTLPVGTTFTFTVPEASAALLTMLGMTFLGVRRSRVRV